MNCAIWSRRTAARSERNSIIEITWWGRLGRKLRFLDIFGVGSKKIVNNFFSHSLKMAHWFDPNGQDRNKRTKRFSYFYGGGGWDRTNDQAVMSRLL